jgi:hypothetical protein
LKEFHTRQTRSAAVESHKTGTPEVRRLRDKKAVGKVSAWKLVEQIQGLFHRGVSDQAPSRSTLGWRGQVLDVKAFLTNHEMENFDTITVNDFTFRAC